MIRLFSYHPLARHNKVTIWYISMKRYSDVYEVKPVCAGLGGSDGCAVDWRPGGRGFNPRRGRQHSFVEIDHEIQLTLVISTSRISNNRLSRSENLVPA